MSLPIFKDDNRNFMQMQTVWQSQIQPILNAPANQSVILKNVSLLSASNPNVVNHLLGRNLQGWSVIRQRASAIIWDSQDSNQSPQLTLNLRTSADVTVDIEVF